MRGILVYDKVGAKRNEWFINSLIENFNKKKVDLRLVVVDNDGFEFDENIDFAIVRTIAPRINERLENAGVRVMNNYKTSLIANDKWETYLLAKRLNIRVMPTYRCVEEIDEKAFPYVVKSRAGHGGSEVFWAENMSELIAVKERLDKDKIPFIIQSPSTTLGKDMRVYVMGGKIIEGILRSNPNSFKSNFSLGGTATKFAVCEKQIEVVNKLCDYLKCDYVGVDFIIDNGEWILNEIEDVVGSRMLYETTDFDVAKEYANYIVSVLKRGK